MKREGRLWIHQGPRRLDQRIDRSWERAQQHGLREEKGPNLQELRKQSHQQEVLVPDGGQEEPLKEKPEVFFLVPFPQVQP